MLDELFVVSAEQHLGRKFFVGLRGPLFNGKFPRINNLEFVSFRLCATYLNLG